jgi:hypothetical protein
VKVSSRGPSCFSGFSLRLPLLPLDTCPGSTAVDPLRVPGPNWPSVSNASVQVAQDMVDINRDCRLGGSAARLAIYSCHESSAWPGSAGRTEVGASDIEGRGIYCRVT